MLILSITKTMTGASDMGGAKMAIRNSVTTEDNANFIIVPEMRNGMLVWREVKTN